MSCFSQSLQLITKDMVYHPAAQQPLYITKSLVSYYYQSNLAFQPLQSLISAYSTRKYAHQVECSFYMLESLVEQKVNHNCYTEYQ